MVKKVGNSITGNMNDVTKVIKVGAVQGPGSSPIRCIKSPCPGTAGYPTTNLPKSKRWQKTIHENIPVVANTPRQRKTKRSPLKPYWEGVDPRKLSAGDLLRWKGSKTNLF